MILVRGKIQAQVGSRQRVILIFLVEQKEELFVQTIIPEWRLQSALAMVREIKQSQNFKHGPCSYGDFW
jgi:competence CoiA-like predicted nuclease